MCGVYPVFKKLSNSFCFKFLKHLENSELLIFNTANWKYSASKIIPDFFSSAYNIHITRKKFHIQSEGNYLCANFCGNSVLGI